jgi:hypothetical protein
MVLLPILVATGLANAPPSVTHAIQLYSLRHSLNAGGHAARPEELFQAQSNEDLARRRTAFERCASLASSSLGKAHGEGAFGEAEFYLVGSKYRENGGLRVFVTATTARLASGDNLARTLDISCDIDSRGNVRRLDLGRTG